MRKALLFLLATWLFISAAAFAQMRTLPVNAKRATVGQQKYALPMLDIGGKALKLAPGGVIYDTNNRSILHGNLPAGVEVAYTLDMNGDVARIYIMTPQEQAQFKPKP
jgi:hypothetical protein